MRIRVLSYNVHKCIGGIDRRYRPERVLETIAHYEPDVVMLQEVDEGARRTMFHRQVDLLGDKMGLRHRTYFPNVSLRDGGGYGNAVLSRYPLTDTMNIDLTIGRRKRRSVLHGRYRVRAPNGRRARTLHVFNLHLGLSGGERKAQLRRFLESHPFAGLHHNTPIVVAGDFNDVWGTLGTEFLVPAGFRGIAQPLYTFPAYAPVRALDSIYVRGDLQIAHVFRSQLAIARQASDHLPLIADLEMSR